MWSATLTVCGEQSGSSLVGSGQVCCVSRLYKPLIVGPTSYFLPSFPVPTCLPDPPEVRPVLVGAEETVSAVLSGMTSWEIKGSFFAKEMVFSAFFPLSNKSVWLSMTRLIGLALGTCQLSMRERDAARFDASLFNTCLIHCCKDLDK